MPVGSAARSLLFGAGGGGDEVGDGLAAVGGERGEGAELGLVDAAIAQ